MLNLSLSHTLLGLSFACFALALPQEAPTHVKASNVLHFIESQHSIPWQQVSDNIKSATFTSDEWANWSSKALANGNGTHVTQAAVKKRKTDGRSVSCYKSGSWAYDDTIKQSIPTLCNEFKWGQASGSVQTLSIGNLYNEAQDEMNLVSTFTVKQAGWGSYSYCANALYDLVEDGNCQGDHDDTRGGATESDATIFTLDPTTLNCNC